MFGLYEKATPQWTLSTLIICLCSISSVVQVGLLRKSGSILKTLCHENKDQLLLREAQEDAAFKELCDLIRESNDQSANAVKAMSNSFVQVDKRKRMKQSMDALLAMSNAHAPAPAMMPEMHAQNFTLQRNYFKQNRSQ